MDQKRLGCRARSASSEKSVEDFPSDPRRGVFSLDPFSWDKIQKCPHRCVLPVSPVRVDVVAVLNQIA